MEEKIIEKICDDFCDDFYDRQMYIECIEKAKVAFDLFKKHSISNYRLWTCLIMIARSYNKLDDVDNSIKYTLKSMKYVETKDKEIEGLWTLARCYAIHKNFDQSEHYFNIVFSYYKEMESNLNLAKAYNMKAWYFNDLDLAKESLKLFKSLSTNDQLKNSGVKKSILDTLEKLMSN